MVSLHRAEEFSRIGEMEHSDEGGVGRALDLIAGLLLLGLGVALTSGFAGGLLHGMIPGGAGGLGSPDIAAAVFIALMAALVGFGGFLVYHALKPKRTMGE
jgi:hypothetical protein